MRISMREFLSMDRRDRELLDRQTRHIATGPRGAGILAMTGAAIFVAGLMLGALAERDAGTPGTANQSIPTVLATILHTAAH
jgi:hypothetical protein